MRSPLFTRVAALGVPLLIGFASTARVAAQPAPPAAQMPGMSGPAATENMTAMDKMNRAMGAAPMTSDPDRAFVGMMMPHHQGAIEMAQIELKYGKDPELRRMATDIVAAQEKEIAEMRAWQAGHPAP